MIGNMENRENTISNDFKIAKTTHKLKATKTKQPKLYLYEQKTWEMAAIEPKTVDIRNRDCTGWDMNVFLVNIYRVDKLTEL